MADRNIPFPDRGGRSQARQSLQDQVKSINCSCGSERFRPSLDVLLVQDRLNPKMCGPAQIIEFLCVKCGEAYMPSEHGFKKVPGENIKENPEPLAGGSDA